MRRTLAAVAVLVATTAFAGEPAAKLIHKTLHVSGTNDEWTSADIKLQPGDLVIVQAEGKVKVGDWIGEVGPNGNIPRSKYESGLHEGTLSYKIGTGAAQAAGAQLLVVADSAGPLKFRVHDTKYEDNKGEFTVDVIVIPKDAIPAATQVAAE